MVLSILQGRRPGIYPFDEISDAKFGFKKLSRSSEQLISNFFLHLRLFDDVRFQCSQIFVVFHFLMLWGFGSSIPSKIFIIILF